MNGDPFQYRGPERREPAAQLTIDQIEFLLARGREDQRAHFDRRIDDMLTTFKSGFPNGDPVEHRKVHESYIEEAKERAELWHELRKRVLSGGVLAAIGVLGTIGWWLASVAWDAFKRDYLK